MFAQRMKAQKGSSGVYTTIGVLLLCLVIFLGWRIGVPFFKYLVFSNFAQKVVNYDRLNKVLDYSMMRSMYDRVYNKAMSLKLPVNERDVIIDSKGDRAVIKASYKMPVDLFIYKFDMSFHVERISEGEGFQEPL